MAKLKEKTVDELEEKVDFYIAENAATLLYEARSYLHEGPLENLDKLVKLLNQLVASFRVQQS